MPYYYVHLNGKYGYIASSSETCVKIRFYKLNRSILIKLHKDTFRTSFNHIMDDIMLSNPFDYIGCFLRVCGNICYRYRYGELIQKINIFAERVDSVSAFDINTVKCFDVIYEQFYLLMNLLIYDKFVSKTLIHIPILKKIKNNQYLHIWRLMNKTFN